MDDDANTAWFKETLGDIRTDVRALREDSTDAQVAIGAVVQKLDDHTREDERHFRMVYKILFGIGGVAGMGAAIAKLAMR